MKQNETRQLLLEGTIRVLAREGIDKATTKQIGLETAKNEAYIYRCFEDKEDLFAKTFDLLDEELANNMLQNVTVMEREEIPFYERCRMYFDAVWNFLLQNREKCLAHVRLYYSPYFSRYCAENHKMRFEPLVRRIRVVFKDEADVWMILNLVMNVMLDFAIKVHNGLMPVTEDYSEHVFRVVYRSIEQYFQKK